MNVKAHGHLPKSTRERLFASGGGQIGHLAGVQISYRRGTLQGCLKIY